jgi:acyl carrier protein
MPEAGNPMGMDSVEIVMRVEEEFAITLSDEEAGGVRTVGQLYSLVLSKIETSDSDRISQAFYRLRRAIMRCLGVPRGAVRPSTPLRVLMPPATRRAAWSSLAEVSGLTFPTLRHPRWARDSIRVLTVAAAIAFLAGMIDWTQPSGIFWLPLSAATGVAAFASLRALYAVTAFLAREFPVRTAGQLAETLLVTNPAEFTSTAIQPLSRREVWLRLAQIISDQLSLDPEEIVPEARFAEDLGVD